MRRNRNYKDDLLADLRSNQEFAAEYLSAAYADSAEAFLVALRDMAEARQGMTQLAEEAQVNRENLYRSLSEQGNPRYSTLRSVLQALGIKKIDFEMEETAAPKSGSSGNDVRKADNITNTAIAEVKTILNSDAPPAATIYLFVGPGLSTNQQIPICEDREITDLCAQGAVVASAQPLGESYAG